MQTYQFPLNELIRTLLRLENLFVNFHAHLNISSNQTKSQISRLFHHDAILSLFQILDVVDRPDFKSDLMQELNRQVTALKDLQGNTSVHEHKLKGFLERIERVTVQLKKNTAKFGQRLWHHDWLNTVKQRATLPGGLCSFDVPFYHYWLLQNKKSRVEDFERWSMELSDVFEAVKLLLELVRGNMIPTEKIAVNGMYQEILAREKSKFVQLMQVKIDVQDVYPEISASRYAISMRFMTLDEQKRVIPVHRDVPFVFMLGIFL